jgi:hypothetical protein
MLAQVRSARRTAVDALASLRSQTGFLGYIEAGHLTADNAASAVARSSNPVTQSFLIPFAPDAPASAPIMPMEPIVLARLRTTPPASPLHLSLVEIVRRRYIAFRKDIDRHDKESIRTRQS